MRLKITMLAAALAATAVAQRRLDVERPRANPLARDEKTVAEGREIYNRSCTMCHGLDGTAGDRAPALGAQRRYLRRSDQDLFDAIQKGVPNTLMPPVPLPETEIRKVVVYIRSLRATAADVFVAGDAAHGETLFWGKANCGQCHTIRGRGGLIGPDLSDVGGERSLAAIKQALTQPRTHIPRGYQPVRATIADGRAITGILKNENNFSVQILGSDGRIHLLLRDEVREVAYETRSLMPSGYDKKLAPEEFQDLLAFLSRQARDRQRREQHEEIDLSR